VRSVKSAGNDYNWHYHAGFPGAAMTTEIDLIARIRQRDTGALSELYDLYSSRVYSLAMAILGDGMGAQEVTQDTFMKVWRAPELYRHESGRFTAWLLTITRRLAIDRYRHEQRITGRSTSLDDDNFPELRDSTQDEEARWRDLGHLMDRLPTEQREVITLAYYRGLSQSEIAEHLDVPLGTVKTRLRLGMEKLREAYHELLSA
jgi:RNA polymerase sigma-70 factor (ECF subfamily)